MQKVIIDVPNMGDPQNIVNGSLASALITKTYKNGIFIPKNATNGDVIQILFPNIDKTFSNAIDLNLWWNSQYKAESEDKRKGEGMIYSKDMSDTEFEEWVHCMGICNVDIDGDIKLRVARDLIDDALEYGEEWFDIPADKMTHEQAIRAVKDLRRKVMSLIST